MFEPYFPYTEYNFVSPYNESYLSQLALIIWMKQHRDIFHHIILYVPQKKVKQVWWYYNMMHIMTEFHFGVNYPF